MSGIAVLDLSPIITRLRSVTVAGQSADVAGAAAYAALKSNPPGRSQSIYVVPLADRDQRPRGLGPKSRQETETLFGVIFAIRSLRDHLGKDAVDVLTSWREAVRVRLSGYQPPGCLDGIQRSDGALIGWAWEMTWWQDAYLTNYDFEYIIG